MCIYIYIYASSISSISSIWLLLVVYNYIYKVGVYEELGPQPFAETGGPRVGKSKLSREAIAVNHSSHQVTEFE